MKKTAFITGYTGQDGQFLTDLLLRKGYKVVALVRRVSTEPPIRSRKMFDFSKYIEEGKLVLEQGDLLSPHSLNQIIKKYQPDEVYNLAAQSHVGASFSQPEFTIASILNGTINLITALEDCHEGKWKMYQASTSEMFGDRPVGRTLDENSGFSPNSPYAIAKNAAHQYCVMKRKSGLFISCGILFNHESEIRGGDFVTQKIAKGIRQHFSNGAVLELGNLDAGRDWGYAGDYVQAMHEMLQMDQPDDFVISTGETHTVREFVEESVKTFTEKISWKGTGLDEQGYIDGKLAVIINPEFYRPNEVGYLNGDSTKARRKLGWSPKVSFSELVNRMTVTE